MIIKQISAVIGTISIVLGNIFLSSYISTSEWKIDALCYIFHRKMIEKGRIHALFPSIASIKVT